MAHNQVTNGKVYTKRRIQDIAEKAGLEARYQNIGGGWNWFVTTPAGAPCFQGPADRVALWLQGYARAVENTRKETG